MIVNSSQLGSILPSTDPQPALMVTEVGDAKWRKVFKEIKTNQRLAYAQSKNAVREHQAWVNVDSSDDWGSIPADELAGLHGPVIIPNPKQIPYENLVDWVDVENENAS